MKKRVLTGLLASLGLSATLPAATIGGSVYDSAGAAIAQAKASLINPDTGSRQETITSSDGKFSFENLPAGQFLVRVDKPGFAPLLREFNVQPDSTVQRGLVLQLSAEQEQGRTQVDSGDVSATQNPANPQQLRVGGAKQQAKLIQKINPVYPLNAKSAHIQGTVTLDVSISKEGIPEDIRVLSSPSEDLAQSALEAVRQWRYATTLLNGEPISVVTEVKVNYTLTQ